METSRDTTLSELIEERRVKLGLTKAEAARRAGVSRGTWHEVESGKRTQTLAGTLALFDSALEYRQGTLRDKARGIEPGPDAEMTAPDLEAVNAEAVTSQARQELVTFAYDADITTVMAILKFIEGGLSVGADQANLAEVRREISALWAAVMNAGFHNRQEGAGANDRLGGFEHADRDSPPTGAVDDVPARDGSDDTPPRTRDRRHSTSAGQSR